jgi:hypothetical protein
VPNKIPLIGRVILRSIALGAQTRLAEAGRVSNRVGAPRSRPRCERTRRGLTPSHAMLAVRPRGRGYPSAAMVLSIAAISSDFPNERSGFEGLHSRISITRYLRTVTEPLKLQPINGRGLSRNEHRGELASTWRCGAEALSCGRALVGRRAPLSI